MTARSVACSRATRESGRALNVVWCRRGVEIEVQAVYPDKRRTIVRLFLTPAQARRVSRMLVGRDNA